MRRQLLALSLVLALLGCGGGQRRAPGAVGDQDAIVTIACEVADATVWVDGREIRQVRDLKAGVALAPGTYRLEVRHDDYHAVYLEVTVAKGERKQLAVEMAPVLP